MKKIAVIGMGQGGMVAAIKLAQAGADVTIYEKKPEGEVSYPWRDDIRSDIFQKVGLPPLPDNAYVQKPNWLFVSPDYTGRLAVPVLKPLEEISVDRRALSAYFARLAKEAGCTVLYDTPVQALCLQDERVVGVQVAQQTVLYDLIIDASGLMSPFRRQIPAKFGVQAEPGPHDYFVGHRAFFALQPNADTFDPAINCTLIVKHCRAEGISWCNRSPEGTVDVLIGRVGHLDESQIQSQLQDLRAHHAILSQTLLSRQTVPICLRKGIARPVADGYVALGDSAFMTIPVMGSGIEASMEGGHLFAEWVVSNKVQDFTAAAMWGFYVNYMRKLGKGFALMDAIRRCALRWAPDVFNWALSGKFLQYKQLAYVMLAKGYGKPRLPLGAFVGTVCRLVAKPSVNKRLLAALGHGLKAMFIASKMPKTYDPKRLAKWQARYDAHTATLDAVTAKYNR